MRNNLFGWSYPPGCSGPPEDESDSCICGLPVSKWFAYCGPSCEQADEEGTVDFDFPDHVVDIPHVLYRRYE